MLLCWHFSWWWAITAVHEDRQHYRCRKCVTGLWPTLRPTVISLRKPSLTASQSRGDRQSTAGIWSRRKGSQLCNRQGQSSSPSSKISSRALHRLLLNLGGPRAEVRYLYMGVVWSMFFYGAPVWSKDLEGSSRCMAQNSGVSAGSRSATGWLWSPRDVLWRNG